MDEPRPGDRDRGHLHIGVLEEVEQRHRVVGPTVGVDDDKSGIVVRTGSSGVRLVVAAAGGDRADQQQNDGHN